jgi:phosphate transport system permease protein
MTRRAKELRHWWRNAKSAAISVLCFLCALAVLMPLALVLSYLLRAGAQALNWDFFTHLPKPPGQMGGGMANAIVGSLVLVGLALLVGVPLGVLGGIYLAEYRSQRLSAIIRFAADLLNGTPSIVWGIVVYALVVVPMKGSSALAGGLALGFIMIPLLLRTTEEMLLLVPGTYREAAFALGIARWKVILCIVAKSAGKGIVTGILLAAARVAGETAPLLFTAFGNQFWSHKLTEPIAALPLQIFTYALSPYDDWRRQAWAGALVLILIVLAFNVAVRMITGAKKWPWTK